MQIKLLIFDVDGTLTDGSITYGDNDEFKTFNIKDGLAIHAMSKLRIEVVFLTGRESEAVKRRAADINATAIQGVSDKETMLSKLLQERGIKSENAAYIGDDLNDYLAMKMCGFKSCPADAAKEIRELCDYVSPYNGGHGAVRDICEFLLNKLDKYDDLLKFYGLK